MAVPYFTIEPEVINAAEDETIEFRCEASGVPKPQIKWIHNGRPISESPPNPRRKVIYIFKQYYLMNNISIQFIFILMGMLKILPKLFV